MGPCAEAFTFANPFSRPKSGNARMNLIETERLAIRKMEDADDAFILGLLKRDQLEHPDIGFALAEEYWGMGLCDGGCTCRDGLRSDVTGAFAHRRDHIARERSIHSIARKVGFTQRTKVSNEGR